MPKMLSTTSFRAVTLADRNMEIMRLRRTTTLTLEEIGNEVGCDKAMVHRVIKRAVAGMMEREVAELRVHELARLQRMEDDALIQSYRFYPELDDDGHIIQIPLYTAEGVAVLTPSGAPMLTPKRDFNIANQGKALLLKISEQRAKLLGLYAPQQVQQMGEDGPLVRQITFSVVHANEGRMVEAAPAQQADAPVDAAPADGVVTTLG